MKKFPGSAFSFKLLYDKSSTSKTGKAPKPRGRVLKRLIEQFKILSFGIEDNERGSSSKWLFDRFKISRLTKLAMPGGIDDSLLKLKVIRVRNVMFTKSHKRVSINSARGKKRAVGLRRAKKVRFIHQQFTLRTADPLVTSFNTPTLRCVTTNRSAIFQHLFIFLLIFTSFINLILLFSILQIKTPT